MTTDYIINTLRHEGQELTVANRFAVRREDGTVVAVSIPVNPTTGDRVELLYDSPVPQVQQMDEATFAGFREAMAEPIKEGSFFIVDENRTLELPLNERRAWRKVQEML